MRHRSRVTLVAASVPVAFFAVLAACSNADNTNPDSGIDATADTNQKADVVVADVGATDGNTDTGVDAGASCDAANLGCPLVTTLHPPKTDAGPQTVFCPRSGTDGGKADYCMPQTQHCCEGQTVGSCVATQTNCAPSDIDWQCEDPISDCAGGHACCGRGILATGLGSGCGNSALCFTGTYCSTGATCASGEIEMCTSTAECSGGSCTPFTIGSNQVGACH